MAYNVIIAPKAAKEIDDAMAWYADISLEIAKKWYGGILSHIATLEEHP